MQIELIDYLMAIGAVIFAIAVGGVCLVGLLVWIGGWSWKAPRQVK